ncbi:MAG: STAS domain-containing protein [candidate division Zixibacteria bacterium]|nr:STAS domain-containing protein [candidate division Zixibacteria bacterium]
MELHSETIGAILVATYGEPSLDASNNREFVEGFSALLTPGARIVLDMSHLRFVDSSGLGSMMLCMRRLKGAGGDLKLCGLSGSVMALFELVRMNRVFDIYPTREEAIRVLET